MLSRNARNIALREGPVSGSRLSSPTPTPTKGDQIPMPSSAQLSAPSNNVVWALIANSALFRSTDKGNAWEQRSLPAAIGGGLLEASFVDDRKGWLLHPGVAASQCSDAGAEIWRTTDGAMTWQRVANVDQQNQASGLGFSQCKESLSFVDATHGFVAAGDGNFSPTIYRTADGGKTWSGSTLPDPPDFKTSPGGSALRAGLVNRFGSTLYVQARGQQAGDIPDRQYMFRSTDGGATWSWMTKVPPRSIVMVTESRWLQLLIPGQSTESINSGLQWHPYESDFNTDTPVGRPQIVFADSQVGYAEGRGALQRTVDGGLHWVRIATPGTVAPLPADTKDWPAYSSSEYGYSLRYSPRWFDLAGIGIPSEHYFANKKNAGAPLSMAPDEVFVGVSVDCFYMVGPSALIAKTDIVVDAVPSVRYVVKATNGEQGTLFAAEATIEPRGLCYRVSMIARTQKAIESNLADFDLMLQTMRFSERTAPITASPRPTRPPTS
jgi:photosystem II stability/assembly factor-like uncharacterized protein